MVYKVVPDNQILRSFDNVPRFAKAQEVIANRLNVRHGTPCIGIHQIARNASTYLTMVTFTSPAGRFNITTN